MQYANAVEVKIGKTGITLTVINHLKTLIKKHKILKVRFLKSTKIDKTRLPGKIVKEIGRTIILKEK